MGKALIALVNDVTSDRKFKRNPVLELAVFAITVVVFMALAFAIAKVPQTISFYDKSGPYSNHNEIYEVSSHIKDTVVDRLEIGN